MKSLTIFLSLLLCSHLILSQQYTDDYTVFGAGGYEAIDVVYDNDVNTYVLGSAQHGGLKKGLLIAYGEELNESWSKFITSGDNDTPLGIQINHDNYLFVVVNSDQNDAYIYVYDRDGNPLSLDTHSGVTFEAFKVKQTGSVTDVYVAGSNASGDAYLARVSYDDRGTVGGGWETTYSGMSSQGAGFLDVEIDPNDNGIVAIGHQNAGASITPLIAHFAANNGSRLDEFAMDFALDFDHTRGMKLVLQDQGNSVANYVAIYVSDDEFVQDYYQVSNFASVAFTELTVQGTDSFFENNSSEYLTGAALSPDNFLTISTSHQLATFSTFYVTSIASTFIKRTSTGASGDNEFAFDSEGDIYLGFGTSSLDFEKYDINLNLVDQGSSLSGNAQNFGGFLLYGDAPYVIGATSGGGIHNSQFCGAPRIQIDETISEFDQGEDKFLICPDENVTITPTLPGGASFQWDPASDISNVNMLVQTFSTPGVYFLNVTSSGGCTNRRSVIVEEESNLPAKIIFADERPILNENDSDADQSLTSPISLDLRGHLQAGGTVFIYEYYWMRDDGSGPSLVGITENQETITVTEPGEYYAELYWGGGTFAGCDYQKTFSVFVEEIPVITFDPIPTKTFGDPDFNLGVTVSTSSTLLYESSNESVATVAADGTVTVVGAGLTTITASVEATANFGAAEEMQTLTVIKADQSINFGVLSDVKLSDSNFPISATASSGLTVTFSSSNTSIVDFSGNTVLINGVGTATVTASQSGNLNYNAAPEIDQSLTVNKGEQTINFSSLSDKNVNSPDFDLFATSSAGLTVSFSSSDENVATISGTTVSIIAAGQTTITASQSGNSDYEAAPNVDQILNVNKLSQTVSIDDVGTQTFGDAPFFFYISNTAGIDEMTLDSSDESVISFDPPEDLGGGLFRALINFNGVGTATLTATQPGNATYESSFETSEATVVKADQTITFGSLPDKTFGDADFDLSATASSGLAVAYSSSDEAVATISGNTVTIVGVGITTITASQPGNANYNAAEDADQSLTVNKASQSISFGTLANRTFGDVDFDLMGSATSGLSVTYESSDLSVATILGSTVTIVGAGSTTITASQVGNANYNAASDVPKSLTIDKADQAITFGSLADLAIGESVTLNATASSGLSVNYNVSGPVSVDGNELTGVSLGTVTVTAQQAGNGNYNAAMDVQQNFEVVESKSEQTITFGTLATKTFGDDPFNLTASASSGLVVSYSSSDETIATISGNTVTIVGAGTTTITVSQAGDDDYLAADDVVQVLTVEKADQSLTFELGENVTKTIGDPPFTLGGSASSGLEVIYSSSNSTVASIDEEKLVINGAGTATITASQPGNNNYNSAASIEQTITVNKVEQTITFNPVSISNQNLSDGSVIFDVTTDPGNPLTVRVKSGPATVIDIGPETYEATFTGEGEVVIEATVDETDDYQAAIHEISFLVVDDSKDSQVITFGALEVKTFGDSPFELSGSSTSGLEVSYTSSDGSVAEISGNVVTITGAGSTTITAIQNGNDDYLAASDVSQTLVVDKADQDISISDIDDKETNDPPFEVVAETSSGLSLTYSVTGPATISGQTITLDGVVGAVTVTVSQEGNINYNTAEAQTSFEVLELALGLDSDSPILLYPNPVKDYLWIQSEESVTLRIFSLNGNLVIVQDSASDKIDLKDLRPGMYLIEISSDSNSLHSRFIKAN